MGRVFPGGPVQKIMLASVDDPSLIPDLGRLHMLGQLSPRATPPVFCMREAAAMRRPHAATKSRHHPLQLEKALGEGDKRLSATKINEIK